MKKLCGLHHAPAYIFKFSVSKLANKLTKGVIRVDAVRDAAGKLVCMVNTEDKAIEIVRNGMRTTIQFMPDGTVATTSEKVIKTA